MTAPLKLRLDVVSDVVCPWCYIGKRRLEGAIALTNDIEVSVLAIMGEKVRIGIQAPRDIPVFRKEVYIEIQEEGSEGHKGAREEVDAALRTLGDPTDT